MNDAPTRPASRRVLVAIAAGMLAALLGGLGATAMLDDAFRRRAATPERALPAPVTVLGIDAADPWPWPAGRIADLLERLHADGVRGVALDLPLADNSDTDPAGTARLVRLLLEGRTVLGVPLATHADGRPRARLPAVGFADAARLGHVLLPRDADGRIRRHLPYVIAEDGIGWPSLALALERSADAGGLAPADPPGTWLVSYTTPVPARRAAEVLAGDREPSLRGHWILVGLTDPARVAPVQGPHGTPALFPVQHQAQALATLLSGTMLRPLPAPVQATLTFILVAGTVLLAIAHGWRHRRAPTALLGGVLASLVLSAGLLGRQVWFAPGAGAGVLGVLLLAWIAAALQRSLRTRQRLPGLATRRRLQAALHAAGAAHAPHALLLFDTTAVGAAPAHGASDPRAGNGTSHVAAAEDRLARLLHTRARRPGDIAAYLGAGRFALLLPGTSAAAAEHILEDIRAQAAAEGVSPALRGDVHACGDSGCDCVRLPDLRRSRPGPAPAP